MKRRRWSATADAMWRALRQLHHHPAQADEAGLSRRERTRRFKEKLVLRYGTPNRCC